MNRLDVDERPGVSVGLEHLSLREEPLSVFVEAAAAGGAETVCLSVAHPGVHDRRVLRETLSQLDALNLSVAMGDGFLLAPEEGLDGLRRKLDVLAELGAPLANTCAFEPDAGLRRGPGHIEDLLGEFCQVARTAQVDVLIEFTPLSHVPSLAAAVELVERLDQPNLRILVDTLHLARAGEGPDDVRNVDRRLFGYCQLSDGPRVSESLSAYLDEAVNERAIPGDGEFPLGEVLSFLPRGITVSAEVPLRGLKQAGISPKERARRILDGSRRLVARAWM
ncbi:sugar phosphate isomerase/epimerase family protein [Streptomyces sp. MMG1533]|uniref:sugar phosphate isomerase/epimerase family protein n=1 Tax=Streptomyces sp. MMG1533 TaxID=1415546 RepID=UPI00131E8D49|nr:TIM barrel protein [Streptomyces sp. MMG1533]